jgi:copper chaperone
VTDAVAALPSVTDVAVDLEAGAASLTYDPAKVSLKDVKEAIEDQGYDIA